MKFRIFVISIFFVVFGQSQEKKDQSLLWEISGNGLSKKSYMYGTMHVSEKVSYHLSDAFFTHLLNADFVANESEPSTWADINELMNFSGNYFGSYNYYRSFYQKPIEKEDVFKHFRNQNFSMNNLLYRTNEYRKEFQEETYLDMFIYQTGRKYNKKTVGLEDVKESMSLIMNIEYDDERPDEEKIQKLNKILKGKYQQEAMVDFYREKDLDMLDSLIMLTSPKSFIDNMLVKRNRIMVQSMDSIMKIGSLFAAVGAAHLPGEQGMIEMLRAMGYTVTPVFSDYTDEGRKTKKRIDEYFVKPKLKPFVTNDGYIEVPLFEMILPQGTDVNSPDLKNGGYINIKRSPLMGYLKKNKEHQIHQTLDSLFFENIPGDILEKKFVERDNYKMYDIKNKTKSGNYQRYQFYVTPLELISISMVGTGDYVKEYQDLVFPNIKINTKQQGWDEWQPHHRNFKIKAPKNRVVYGDKKDPIYPDNLQMYGIDDATNTFYWFQDSNFPRNELGDHAFDLKRIHQEVLLQYDAQKDMEFLETTIDYAVSKSKIYGKPSYIKTFIDGISLNFMACVNCTEEQFRVFESSYQSNNEQLLTSDYKTYTDNVAYFSVEVPFKQNEMYFLRDNKKPKPSTRKKTNHFQSYQNSFEFSDKVGNSVNVFSYEYHPYEHEKSLDSILVDFKKRYQKAEPKSDADIDLADRNEMIESLIDDEDDVLEVAMLYDYRDNYYTSQKAGPIKSQWDKMLGLDKIDKFSSQYKLMNEKTTIDRENKKLDYSAFVTHPMAKNQLKVKLIVRDGIKYHLLSLVPTDTTKISPFIKKFYKDFKPKDTLLGHNIFEPKIEKFIDDLYSDYDSIRYSAIKSASYLTIEPQEFKLIEELIDDLDFEDEELDALASIITKVGKIKDRKTIDFLVKNYLKDDVPPSIQFAILRALAMQKSKEAYQKINYLMDKDLPISDNSYDIEGLFGMFQSDLDNSVILMPKIFEYYSIPEYNKPLIDFAKKLMEENKMSAKQLKSYKKLLLTNTKLEFKRVKSWNSKRKGNQYSSYEQPYTIAKNLNSFLYLLEPFRKDKDVAPVWENIRALDVNEINIEMLNLESKKGQLSKTWIEELSSDLRSKFYTYNILKKNKSSYTPKSFDEEKMALSAVYLLDLIDPEKKEVTFLTKEYATHDDKQVVFFFYKSSNKDKDDNSYYYYDNQSKLLSIGFVLDDKSQIVWEAFYSGLQKTIDDEDKLEDYYQEVIDKSINHKRENASFGKIKNNGYNELYDDYYDY